MMLMVGHQVQLPAACRYHQFCFYLFKIFVQIGSVSVCTVLRTAYSLIPPSGNWLFDIHNMGIYWIWLEMFVWMENKQNIHCYFRYLFAVFDRFKAKLKFESAETLNIAILGSRKSNYIFLSKQILNKSNTNQIQTKYKSNKSKLANSQIHTKYQDALSLFSLQKHVSATSQTELTLF